MIYDRASAVNTADGVITKTTLDRQTVHSMFYNDVRHDWANAMEGTGKLAIRGNIRQVGAKVRNCGPGVIVTDGNHRCTWNWNFIVNDLAGDDAEDWFERVAPLNHIVWAGGADTDRNVETDVFSGLITKIVAQHTFSIVFQNDDDIGTNTVDTDDMFMLDASKYFTDPVAESITAAGHAFTFSMHCRKSDVDGNGDIIGGITAFDAGDNPAADNNIRDLFPDCYFGDEIHFTYQLENTNKANGDERLNAWYTYTTFPAAGGNW